MKPSLLLTQNEKIGRSLMLLMVIGIVILAGCKDDDNNNDDNQVDYDPTSYILIYPDHIQDPDLNEDNPMTVAGVELGRLLFHESLMSSDGSQSCASCHNQNNAFSDTAKFSIGVNGLPGGRQAMAIVNMAWNSNGFFWDGRAPLLRNQSLLPIQDPLEMDETLENVISKLSGQQKYRDAFKRAFDSESITSEKMSLAMEQFMNSMMSFNSKYDQYLQGDAELSESEERGRVLFFAEYNPFFPEVSGADCAHCHGGSNFENDEYMNNGLDTDAEFLDDGHMNVTMDPMDRAKFKVPTLRNIALTPPYMHDGRFTTLEEVVAHYNEEIQISSTVDPALQATEATGLMLDAQDVEDLVAFLHTLTDDEFLQNSAFGDPH